MAFEDTRTKNATTKQASARPAAPAGIAGHRHGSELRGLMAVPNSQLFSGRFGRMFRRLPVFGQPPDALRALAAGMVSEKEDQPTPEGQVDDEETTKPIPAGYTYLGQFIDHDLTFDPTSSLDRQNDPDALTNFRTPRFDLDSVYGRGPADQPYLYDQQRSVGAARDTGLSFLLGASVSNNPLVAGPDLPRNAQGRALIGDPRNDENLIVSQLQSTMLRFHNRMVERVAASTPLTGGDLFKEAQRLVRWHYQWVVIHDFLPRIVGQEMVDLVFPIDTDDDDGNSGPARKPKLRFYTPRNNSYMPVEFSGAAYRFGHSMVRPIYRFNSIVPRAPIFSGNFDPANLENLNGFRPLPREWGFEWRFFFELGGNQPNQPMQKAYRIDQQLVNPLGTLPPAIATNPPSLAERNLMRGLRLGLPSGQSVARAMGVPVIPDKDLLVGPRGDANRKSIVDFGAAFAGNAPLWYYILREAELQNDGNQLGPVGGRLVAEVFVGILARDPASYQSVNPSWTPDLEGPGGRFGMPELVSFALS